MRASSVLWLVPALVAMTGCEFDDMGDFGRFHEDFHFNYPVKAGARLSVESFNGAIEVSPWDQDSVDISGTKYARSPDQIADVKVNIDHQPNGVTIHATRPTSRYGNYGARFAIKVPRSMVLDRLITSNGSIRASEGVGPGKLKTSNGSVHVQGFRGELNVETSNGAVELTKVEGALNASTSNGSIHAKVERADTGVKLGTSNGGIELTLASGIGVPVRAHTSNSSITVHLPADVNAHLSANTSNGSITSDFEMRMRGEISKHHLEGSLGNGGPLIDLSTSNGAIRIVR